jgi:DNA-binding NtrC family response regulator
MTAKQQFADLAGARILVIEDDEDMRDLVQEILDGRVAALQLAATCTEGLAAAKRESFDVALIDINLPDGTGFDIIKQLKRDKINLPVVLITGYIDEKLAAEADRVGNQMLLTKPFTPTQLMFSLNREMARKNRRERHAGGTANSDPAGYGLIGISRYARELRRKIEDYAAGDMPVLITGPTGTGKEIIARAIHACSSRGEKPLFTVNSSAIPEHLEESEFFGHSRGAFTGAHQAKDGILKCADGSSLFLDEVAELSLRMQVKLLRVLDGHEFTPVGETRPVHSDIRLISATNRPLQEMIVHGQFREDLFFRLKAALITTEPLNAHKEDVPALIKHFLSHMSSQNNREFIMSAEALEVMEHYSWPGNVRELKNTIETLCSLSRDSDLLDRENVLWVISETAGNDHSPVVQFSEAKIDFEREYYRKLLIKCNNNISMAARESGIERAYFSKRIRALGLAALSRATAKKSVQKTAHS